MMADVGDQAKDNATRILVLAPVGNDAPLTVRLLNEDAIAAGAVRDMHELVRQIEHGCGAILVAEEALGPEAMQLLTSTLDNQPSWSDIPIILITSSREPTNAMLQRLTLFGPAGIVSLLERPFRPMAMLNAAQVALRSRQRQYQVRDLLAERQALLANLEERVARRTSELRDMNVQLEEMVYTIAHDLRGPLRSIHGFAAMLLEDAELSERSRMLAQRVARAASSMDTLTLDLLEYGRVARAQVSLEPVFLQKAWEAAVAQSEAAIRETAAVIEVQQPLPSVRGHLPILTQIMANLLGNALKFVREGEPPLIRAGAKTENDLVTFWIRDNGIGIAPEYHARIFNVFERLESRRYKGTGIGLSIVRKGIERLGGRVGVESKLGEGACFWFELPAAG
jgi:signal transduction histidine kinase